MSSYGHQTPDLELGQAQYERGQSGMAKALAIRRDIETQLKFAAAKQAELVLAQQALLNSISSSEDQQQRRHIDLVGGNIMACFGSARNMLAELKRGASPENQQVQEQIHYVGEKIRQDIEVYRAAQSDFDRQMRSQVRRRYQIAHEDASPEEIDQGVENLILGQDQMFAIQGIRSQQAKDARDVVMQRSAAIRKIEQDLIALAEISQEVANLVNQHDYAVTEIKRGADETHEHVHEANHLLDKGIVSARNVRKWKWWALGTCLLILGIIVVLVIILKATHVI
ncbi:hypothetical protein N7493_000554 [Penicillium malachiteum]|uniref:t-SNARE coiled-coil homology domain-containing protein n=1 Tax=Penicillium malachiteum TaxID=1324776 RepID=A0AAD6N132_9EURO|nr:hypothetical protein N7493_000554 [Penicillium malachiteum]